MNFEFDIKNFSLKDSLYCGQCFRFKEISKNKFLIFSKDNSSYVEQNGSRLIFTNSTSDENFWKSYFNFRVDYSSLIKNLKGDILLEKLVGFCGGIRILKQDPFETLFCFIISINNNISRIQNIVEVFCENFGEKNINGYSFPTIENIKHCKEKDFKVLKAGFRTRYILDAIFKISNFEVNLDCLYSMDVSSAEVELRKIYGVGSKVAHCVLLFAYNKMEAFPVDVWIKRVIVEYYKKGLSKQVLSCPGFAQQLLFYGKRSGFI